MPVTLSISIQIRCEAAMQLNAKGSRLVTLSVSIPNEYKRKLDKEGKTI
jgi:hypothetical protein